MIWSVRQAAALRAVFAALDAANLRWMVLRNYEGLPETNRAKDVDLLVAHRDFARAQAAVDGALRSHGFSRVDRLRLQYVWCSTYWTISADTPEPIKIDLLDGFVWRGAQIIDFDDVWAARVRHGSFHVPSPVHDGYMLWVKPLMTGGFVKERYRPDIQRAVSSHPREFEAMLARTAGPRLSRILWPMLSTGNLDGTIPLKSRLCRAAWTRSVLRSPLRTATATVWHVAREVARRSRRPAGSMIGVVGPDGAGKSTFIDLLRTDLARCLVKDADEVRVLHFRPNVFPNLKKLIEGKRFDESAEEFTSPHRARPAGRVSSLFRLTYYWLDYVFGYWLRVRRQCVAGGVCVFDRYFYDFLADPARSRIGLRYWIRRTFLRITPEPDVVFFLDCDATTIYARKRELPIPEIDRQLAEYRTMAARSPRFVTLDARRPPPDSSRAAVRRVVETFFEEL